MKDVARSSPDDDDEQCDDKRPRAAQDRRGFPRKNAKRILYFAEDIACVLIRFLFGVGVGDAGNSILPMAARVSQLSERKIVATIGGFAARASSQSR